MDGNRFESMEEVDIDLKLSVLKPLHASWLIELFDHMTSPDGKAVSLKVWEVAGITDAVKKATSGLPSLDPFHNIDPLSFIPVAIEEDNYSYDFIVIGRTFVLRIEKIIICN